MASVKKARSRLVAPRFCELGSAVRRLTSRSRVAQDAQIHLGHLRFRCRSCCCVKRCIRVVSIDTGRISKIVEHSQTSRCRDTTGGVVMEMQTRRQVPIRLTRFLLCEGSCLQGDSNLSPALGGVGTGGYKGRSSDSCMQATWGGTFGQSRSYLNRVASTTVRMRPDPRRP
jgi:hypothetical protein